MTMTDKELEQLLDECESDRVERKESFADGSGFEVEHGSMAVIVRRRP